MHSDVLIIGGGPAGICAAIAARKKARENGIEDKDFSICVLERNKRLGVKIRISGGGKCNLTHEGTVNQLIGKGFLRKSEQRFLRHALYSFTNKELLDLLEKQGLRTVARDDGKVFPVSGVADDVLRVFEKELGDSIVQVIAGERVERVEKMNGVFSVITEKAEFIADVVVLATGGVSYPKTGTTGDGLKIASSFGHTVRKPSPALAPIYLKPIPPQILAGVSFRGIGLRVAVQGRSVSRAGDLLITHKGISGPACLSLSREAAEMLGEVEKAEVMVDFLPEYASEALKKLLLAQASVNGSGLIRKFLQVQPSIPSSVVSFIMEQAGVDWEEKWGNLTKKARHSLEQTLRNFALGVVRAIPLHSGEVSAGGVVLKEVDPKTMESRVCKGLFLCGELLDYAGEIGGFNLQAAFSSGWLAGSSVC